MRRAALIVLCATTAARADDPRDVFGLKKPEAQEPPDCSDGHAFGCAQPTDPFADISPLATWLPAAYLLSLPTADATHDQVANYALGAGRDEAGAFFGGATGLENRWTIEGAPTDSPRTGASETNVPLAFLDGILVTPGAFSAHDRASTGGTIDAQLRRGTRDHELDARAWLTWNADARHREIAEVTYQVRRGYVDPGPAISTSLVATGPLGASTWYALGVAPSLVQSRFSWDAATLVDDDQDGFPDGFPGVLKLHLIEHDTRSPILYRVPVMARAGWDSGPHHADVTLVGSAASDITYLFNSTIQAGGIDQHTLIGDAIATYRGEWHDTHVRAQFAWHRSSRSQSAHDPAAADIPQFLSTYVPAILPEDPALAGACSDAMGDPYPNLINCPVPLGYFASGGAGPLVDTTADRPSVTAEAAHRIGANVVRVGGTGEDSRLVTSTTFTGGEQIRSLFPGDMAERQFISPDAACPLDPSTACPTVATSVLTYRTRYTAAYVEDTFTPSRDLRVDGGLRWELMWIGPYLHFSDELAPRVSASWDPLGGGQSRIWTSMGRSYAMLPAGIGRTVIGTDRTVDNVTSPFGTGRIVDTGARTTIVPGVAPVAQDELAVGADAAFAKAVRGRVWLQGRWLRRGLDTTTEGLDNPGRDGTIQAIRDTAIFGAELQTAPTAKVALRVGYMYGRTVGSWSGPFNPRQGATLYANNEFVQTTQNLYGSLPTDLGHRVYVEGERRGELFYVATRLTVASGRPRDVLFQDEDFNLQYLLPRGAGGRSAMISQANLRLGATWRGFDFTLDVMNVFDHRDATNVDMVYTGGNLSPIVGGSSEDLLFLVNHSGQPPARRSTYDLGTAFQAPFSAVLGVHRAL